jgi:hypothetical protein
VVVSIFKVLDWCLAEDTRTLIVITSAGYDSDTSHIWKAHTLLLNQFQYPVRVTPEVKDRN